MHAEFCAFKDRLDRQQRVDLNESRERWEFRNSVLMS